MTSDTFPTRKYFHSEFSTHPLHCLVEEGDYERLIEHLSFISPIDGSKLDVNAQNKYDRTPLHYAVMFCRTDMIEPLLKAGANPNIQDGMGLTPLMMYDKPSIDIYQRLIEAGADLNLKSLGGNTILHFMAGGGHIEIVMLLMDNGALSSINNHDKTPVSIAVERGHHNVVDLINYYRCMGVHNEVNYIR